MKMRSVVLGVVCAGLAACGGAGYKVPNLQPSPNVFTKLEAGATKLGWKSERNKKTGVELTVFAPGQEFDAFTQDGDTGGGWGPIAVRFRCKPGPKDKCKDVWNQLSTAGDLGAPAE